MEFQLPRYCKLLLKNNRPFSFLVSLMWGKQARRCKPLPRKLKKKKKHSPFPEKKKWILKHVKNQTNSKLLCRLLETRPPGPLPPFSLPYPNGQRWLCFAQTYSQGTWPSLSPPSSAGHWKICINLFFSLQAENKIDKNFPNRKPGSPVYIFPRGRDYSAKSEFSCRKFQFV